MDSERVSVVSLCHLMVIFCLVSAVLSHDCEIGNPLLNRLGNERCCGDHCSNQEECPTETHECYVEPGNTWSICCHYYGLVPRGKRCVIPSQCKVCRPKEHLMILNGQGCPVCECTSRTPCRNKNCRRNEVCQMITSCEDDLDSCEPEARCTDVCQLPLDHGTCDEFILRWYFDSSDGVCKKFNFGGCNGNENNFPSKQNCLSSCSSTPTDRPIPPSPPRTPSPPTSSSTTTTTQAPAVVEERSKEEDKEEDRETPVGCPLIPCPHCLIPYEVNVFTDAASCQVCRCYLAIKLCEDMPCEDHQKCVMTAPPLCQNHPCKEIPTCITKRVIENEPDSTEEEEEKSNVTENEDEQKDEETEEGKRGNGIESGKQIKESSCPELQCTNQCENDEEFVYDTAGCQTCACANTTCEMLECSANQICRMVQVQCITTPCDPVATCLENALCDANCKTTCDFGSVIATDEDNCSLCYCEKSSGIKLTAHSLVFVIFAIFFVVL